MVPLIQNSVDALVEVLQDCAANGKSVDFIKYGFVRPIDCCMYTCLSCVCICRVYGSFTMETLLAAAFGRVIDIQRGQSDLLTKSAAEFFRGTQEGKKTSLIYLNTVLSNAAHPIHTL